MWKTVLGAVLLLPILAGGCSAESSGTSNSERQTDDEDKNSGGHSGEHKPDDDRAPAVAGDVLPPALIGTFRRESGEFFTFYEAGDELCSDRVGTTQSCYAVRDSSDAAAEPVEMGVAAIDGDVLVTVPTQDPKSGCVGTTNEARWTETPEGVTITPTKDCHGTQPLELERTS